MKRIAIAIPLLLIAANAWAVDRYDIAGMTCEQVQALLSTAGAAILRYPSARSFSLPIYDRFVDGQKECETDEVAARTGVPTADKKYCPVYKCVLSSTFVAR
jgi:hypothetical protein